MSRNRNLLKLNCAIRRLSVVIRHFERGSLIRSLTSKLSDVSPFLEPEGFVLCGKFAHQYLCPNCISWAGRMLSLLQYSATVHANKGTKLPLIQATQEGCTASKRKAKPVGKCGFTIHPPPTAIYNYVWLINQHETKRVDLLRLYTTRLVKSSINFKYLVLQYLALRQDSSARLQIIW